MSYCLYLHMHPHHVHTLTTSVSANTTGAARRRQVFGRCVYQSPLFEYNIHALRTIRGGNYCVIRAATYSLLTHRPHRHIYAIFQQLSHVSELHQSTPDIKLWSLCTQADHDTALDAVTIRLINGGAALLGSIAT